jgi:8-oxo-dGTP diphosphatase
MLQEESIMKQVTAAIIKKNNLILITQRSEKSALPLKWEFPGGKIEPGESPEACLARELKEELDIDARIKDLYMSSLHHYEFGNLELLFYFADIISGEIKLNVHQDFKWASVETLDQYDFAPADVEVVRALMNSI